MRACVGQRRSCHTRTDFNNSQRRTSAEIGQTTSDLGTCGWLVASADDVAYSMNLPPAPSLVICADDRRSSCRHLHLLVYSADAFCCVLSSTAGSLGGGEEGGAIAPSSPPSVFLSP